MVFPSYPRAYGECIIFHRQRTRSIQPSPRMRRIHAHCAHTHEYTPTIPAHVGSTISKVKAFMVKSNHSHSCEEDPSLITRFLHLAPTIPAYAESTSGYWLLNGEYLNHPHRSGERSSSFSNRNLTDQPSPRKQGIPHPSRYSSRCLQLSPRMRGILFTA